MLWWLMTFVVDCHEKWCWWDITMFCWWAQLKKLRCVLHVLRFYTLSLSKPRPPLGALPCFLFVSCVFLFADFVFQKYVFVPQFHLCSKSSSNSHVLLKLAGFRLLLSHVNSNTFFRVFTLGHYEICEFQSFFLPVFPYCCLVGSSTNEFIQNKKNKGAQTHILQQHLSKQLHTAHKQPELKQIT